LTIENSKPVHCLPCLVSTVNQEYILAMLYNVHTLQKTFALTHKGTIPTLPE